MLRVVTKRYIESEARSGKDGLEDKTNILLNIKYELILYILFYKSYY
jgi:hypothetical protein